MKRVRRSIENSSTSVLEELEADKRRKVEMILKNPALAIRELNNRSLYNFLQWAWPILNSQPFQTNWHIEYLCQQLEKIAYGVGNRLPKEHDLLINISPGTTKTMLCSVVFPVWCWTKWFWMRFITASYSGALALESAELSRDLVKSDEFKKIYPELQIKADKDNKSNYRIAKITQSKVINGAPSIQYGGNRFSTSVGGTLTGYHGDILIWDDPLNPQQAFSDKEVEGANRWIDQTLPTRKTNKQVSAIIGIMQRLHENDPTGHLLKKRKKNLKHICLPGEIFAYKDMVKPPALVKYYVNGLFDANRMPVSVLNELETDLGQYGYAGQIGQHPAPAGGGMFKTDMIQIIHEAPLPQDIVKTVRAWDKAASDGTGAYTAGVKMSKLADGRYLIWTVQRGQWDSSDREKRIKNTANADGVKCHVVVEQEPGSGGKESAQATIRNLAGFHTEKDKVTGSKVTRADTFSVQVNNGNVLMMYGEWNKTFTDELSLFPNSRYKDQTDAASSAFSYLTNKKKVKRVT